MTINQKVCVATIKAAGEVLKSAKYLEQKVSRIPTNHEVEFTEEENKAYLEANDVEGCLQMLCDDIDKLQMMLDLVKL